MIEVALFEPEIPQNTGTLIRLSACFGIKINLIRPFGFIWDDRKLKRSGMDYIKKSNYEIFDSYNNFIEYVNKKNKRVVKLIPRMGECFTKFEYKDNDIILGGRESDGFPDFINYDNNPAVYIPCKERSINLAIATAIVTSEALRQTNII